jgi:hypothetical protein
LKLKARVVTESWAGLNGSGVSDTLTGITSVMVSGVNDTVIGGTGSTTLSSNANGNTLMSGAGQTTGAMCRAPWRSHFPEPRNQIPAFGRWNYPPGASSSNGSGRSGGMSCGLAHDLYNLGNHIAPIAADGGPEQIANRSVDHYLGHQRRQRSSLLHKPAFSRYRRPKGSPSVNFAHVRRAYVVERLRGHLPVRLVLIGKPHMRHERISVVGTLDATSARFRFQSQGSKSHSLAVPLS